MNSETIITLIAAILASSGLTALVTGLFNRRKTSAEAEKSIATVAMEVLNKTLEKTVNPLYKRIDELEAKNYEFEKQVEGQAETLDRLGGEFSKLQLGFVINESYIKSLGHDAPVKLVNIESLSTNDLRDIASSMRNIERRQLEAKQTGDQ